MTKRPRRGIRRPSRAAGRLGSDTEEAENAALCQRHPEEHAGIFQSQHIKPFPVRAAIDIGTGGVVSLCVARVDATVGAIQKLMYQTQLPLHLEALPTSMSSPSSPLSASSSSFTLSERTMEDITNKVHILQGAMRRNAFEGLSERAAVLSWPLCLARNAGQLAERLTKEFKVDVRVLGADFDVEWPPSVARFLAGEGASTPETADDSRSTVDKGTRDSVTRKGAENTLKSLLCAARAPTTSGLARHKRKVTAPPSSGSASSRGAMDARTQLDTLAFLAHAAVSQCVAPQRLLVLHEDPQRGLRLLGLGTSAADDIADLLDDATTPEERQSLYAIAHGPGPSLLEAGERTPSSGKQVFVAAHAQSRQQASLLPTLSSMRDCQGSADDGTSSDAAPAAASLMRLVEHPLPVDVASAHRYCITQIQRRPLESYGLHASSPNPLLADEFAALRGLLVGMIQPTLPAWVRRKAQLGGVLCGTSHNGGLLNLAARVSQQTHVSLEHLEVHAQYHFCGLTDVLLAESFPNPFLVLPSVALTAAVLRSLESPRITYLPEVSVAAALLVQPSLWLHARATEVRARLARDPFYASTTAAQRGRMFGRPHRKDNPTAAPDATWVKEGRWNPISFSESMRGT
ncbi:conserved hypothetical protein [Leishmania major strain Friedlin]|uniref:Uncharacterized protein n=1 Tax=Leishmania major TaxID=5664 RepID=E9ACH8_LEIMA|nr:conserved hypothetical protein [Leishmania major strain Friedlin]CAG9567258.1 hypothetical_protein_-_conserved [Leishmania major strain Friedlin]CBZ11995.1 conserved hypothetical protein [Leishmania major strain Friedlin]|eukprot:XP_003721709.1 conserved hypothetical protein [Leishmania major strain Friedlin]